jgi:hypothetical protein
MLPLVDEFRVDYQSFVRKSCPAIFEDDDEVVRCMRYWRLWNGMVEEAERIEGLTYRRFRIEDLDVELLGELVRLVGGTDDEATLATALEEVDRATNAGSPVTSVSWETLPDGEEKEAIAAQARAYGYTAG